MSYILDALKKSEGERERGVVPDWQTDHSGYAVTSAPTHQQIFTISILSAVLVVLLLAVLAWWLSSSGWLGDKTVDEKVAVVAPAAEVQAESVLMPSPDPVPLENRVPDLEPAATTTIAKSTSTVTKTTFEKFKEVQQSALDQDLDPGKATATTVPAPTSTDKAQTNKKGKGKVVFSDTPLDTKQSGPKPKKPVVEISQLPAEIRRNIPGISFAGHVFSTEPTQRSVTINGRKINEGQVIGRELLLEKITADSAEFNYKGWRFRLAALQDWNSSGVAGDTGDDEE